MEIWVVGHLQAFLNSADEAAITAINRIDVALVQLGDEVLSKNEFQAEMAHVASLYSSIWFGPGIGPLEPGQGLVLTYNVNLSSGNFHSEPFYVGSGLSGGVFGMSTSGSKFQAPASP